MGPAVRIDYGAILTGGAARRMGGSKADMPIGGVPLVELAYRSIARSCREVYCVGGTAYLASLGIPTIPDLFPGADSLGGTATALKHALDLSGPNAWVLVTGCDMPLDKAPVLDLLASRREGRDIVAPHVGLGFEPMCTLYRAGVYPVFEEQIRAGNLRIRDVFNKVGTGIVGVEELRAVDPGLHAFVNVNRPEDLEMVRRLEAEGAAMGR